MKNQITSFTHCAKCVQEKPSTVSAEGYARLGVGFTSTGAFQIWCNRHDINVAYIEDLQKTYHMMMEQFPSGCAKCAAGGHQ